MHSILRQQAAQFVAVGGCGCQIIKIDIIIQKISKIQMRIVCALYHQTHMMRSKMTIGNVDN